MTGGTMASVHQLIRRLAARLSRDSQDSRAGLGFPCVFCGEPATGWAVHSTDRNGAQVIDGFAACAAHQADPERLPDSEAV
jgi:hypothetical protein